MVERASRSMETSISNPEQARRKKGIKPITQDEVDLRIKSQHAKIVVDDKHYKSFWRGIEEYLYDESTYAILPGYKGTSARELIERLPEGSTLLDVAFGNGTFLYEVKNGKPPNTEPVNPKIEVYGYDGVRRNIRIDDAHFVKGKLNDLAPETYRREQFHIVTNVATSYHAEDFYGRGLEGMTSMLKPDGLLLVSSLSRAVRTDSYGATKNSRETIIIEDKNGNIIKNITANRTYMRKMYITSQERWSKGRCGGVFKPDGTLISPAEYFSFLQKESDYGFIFEYSVGNSLKLNSPEYDGKLAVKKLREDAELNLKNVFYAKLEIEDLGKSLDKSRLSYIIAETPEQAQELEDNGFVSVGKVDRETRVLQIVKEGIVGKTVEEVVSSRFSHTAIEKLRIGGKIRIEDGVIKENI